MNIDSRRFRRVVRAASLGLVFLPAAACDSFLGTDQAAFAAEARVLLDGTSPVPVLLITSTNFLAQTDPETGQVVTQLLAADTVILTTSDFDVDETYDIFGADRFLVRVANPDDDETASIHLRVLLDGREVFNQRATMRDASLEYTAFHRF